MAWPPSHVNNEIWLSCSKKKSICLMNLCQEVSCWINFFSLYPLISYDVYAKVHGYSVSGFRARAHLYDASISTRNSLRKQPPRIGWIQTRLHKKKYVWTGATHKRKRRAQHKHKRKGSILFVSRQTNKYIQSDWGETLRLRTSLCLSHSCEGHCACAYAFCVVRVNQP